MTPAPKPRPPAAETSNAPVLLSARGLIRTHDGTRVLRGVDLELAPAERLAIMGPSGSGKSTLLNCLGGIDRPDAGEIWLGGECLNHLSGAELARLRRESISTIFQFFHLLPTLSVRENIEFPLLLQPVDREERTARVERMIDAVGLRDRQHGFPDELSGGEMQRVALARALVHQPKLVLADEPTGNLDSRTGASVLSLIERLCEEHRTALILVTHSEAATRICGRTLHMRDGLLEPAAS